MFASIPDTHTKNYSYVQIILIILQKYMCTSDILHTTRIQINNKPEKFIRVNYNNEMCSNTHFVNCIVFTKSKENIILIFTYRYNNTIKKLLKATKTTSNKRVFLYRRLRTVNKALVPTDYGYVVTTNDSTYFTIID